MYKPLPDGITIKNSDVQGLGVFATKDFDAETVLGIVHVKNKNFPSQDHVYLMKPHLVSDKGKKNE